MAPRHNSTTKARNGLRITVIAFLCIAIYVFILFAFAVIGFLTPGFDLFWGQHRPPAAYVMALSQIWSLLGPFVLVAAAVTYEQGRWSFASKIASKIMKGPLGALLCVVLAVVAVAALILFLP